MANEKPWGESSEETNLANALILDLEPPKLWRNKFLLFEPPVCYDSSRKLIHTFTLVMDLLQIKIPGATSQINSLFFLFIPMANPASDDGLTLGEKMNIY